MANQGASAANRTRLPVWLAKTQSGWELLFSVV